MHVCRNGNARLARILIMDYHADIDILSQVLIIPWHGCHSGDLQRKYCSLLHLVVVCYKDGWSALMFACMFERFGLVRKLIVNYHASIDIQNKVTRNEL